MKDFKQAFEKLFDKYIRFPQQTKDELYSMLKIITIEKGIDIVVQGKPDINDYFLLSGIIREYTINEDAQEVTLNFYDKESIISPNFCRIYNKKSLLSIQTLTECSIGIIKAEELDKYRNINSDFCIASVKMITDLFKDNLHRQISHASQPGIKKLEQFRSHFPSLENYVPHSYIASYLGITNVSLSRLRKQK